MRRRGTYLTPTIATMVGMLEPRNGAVLQLRGKHRVPRLREAAALAWRVEMVLVIEANGNCHALRNGCASTCSRSRANENNACISSEQMRD